MIYYSGLIQVLLIILLLFVTIEIIKWINHFLLLRELKTKSFPTHYERVLKRIPYYNLLPQDLKLKLHYRMMIFIEEKEWLGIKKDVTYEMKVIISFYACLMTVNISRETYENLTTIYVYPYEFILNEVKSYDGIYTKEKLILEGQSSGGVVIISWHNAKKEAYHFKNHNVIIHEFAHELDFENGVANGIPVLDNLKYKSWANIMFKTYKTLNAKSLTNRFWGKYKLFGYGGAINEAEFFAVASEMFFEKPKSLQKSFPEVYGQLKQFYKIDTIKLFTKRTN